MTRDLRDRLYGLAVLAACLVPVALCLLFAVLSIKAVW